MAYSTVSHEKALHNYFIPRPNVQKTYGNFRKSSKISENFGDASNPLLRSLNYENFGKSLAIFTNFCKTSEMVKNGFKIFGKFSGVFGNFRKTSETVQKCSQMIS